MKKLIVGCVLTALLGCSSTPDTEYYTIPVNEAVSAQVDAKSVRVVLADQLDYNGIVYRTSETKTIVAKQHVWQSELQSMLEASLSQVITQTGENQLKVTFEQFNGSYTGESEISGTWQLLGENGEPLRTENFDLKQPLSDDGYQPLVDALNVSLNQLLSQITYP